jgi:peptidoglycan-associated lipoprotein
MKSIHRHLLLIAAAAAVAGCSTPVKLDEAAPVESRTATPVGIGTAGSGAGTAGAGQSGVASVDLTRGALPPARMDNVILFDFDSYVVKDEYRNIVDAHAKMLTADRKRRISVEGHTDERGGREYNLALGQKRAEAVARSMTLLGATDAQVEAVSFGEERPAVQGSDESAWAKNRRAELVSR